MPVLLLGAQPSATGIALFWMGAATPTADGALRLCSGAPGATNAGGAGGAGGAPGATGATGTPGVTGLEAAEFPPLPTPLVADTMKV